jgi:hypothetical protein
LMNTLIYRYKRILKQAVIAIPVSTPSVRRYALDRRFASCSFVKANRNANRNANRIARKNPKKRNQSKANEEWCTVFHRGVRKIRLDLKVSPPTAGPLT